MKHKPKKHSEYRLMIYNRFGSLVKDELKSLKGNDFFMIKEVSADGVVRCLKHVKEKTRKQYISDVCAELQVRGYIERNGRSFYFVKKRKSVKEKVTHE